MKKRTPKLPVPSEAEVLKACLQTLHFHGIYAWRNNSGCLRDPTGRPVRFGKTGSSDILGLTGSGRLLSIEVKRPGGKLSEPQREFLTAVNASGGVGVVVDDARVLDGYLRLLKNDPWLKFAIGA